MKLFIDGSAGTAGLRIHGRLSGREGVELISLSETDRKNPDCRKEALNSCDFAVLCLPDKASIEAVGLIDNPNVRVIDTSTAHRVDPDWAYGFPELSPDFRRRIAEGKRVASPGCHAGGFVALVYPLIESGILPASALLTCHSVTGYSGGGKKMIAQYKSEDRDGALSSPRQYGLSQVHKHLPEMKGIPGLMFDPVFCPIVADYLCGMVVTVPLHVSQLKDGANLDTIKKIYRAKYTGPVVKYTDAMDEDGFIAANTLADTDAMQVTAMGNDERILLISHFDNLGKGASGAALQCLNIMLGESETKGLVL
ncbi:MAG: N-acetyl-gamma-glutamyl-phosphate reductase [Clostridia bacterium]|nr:N-acetyl-gamma-glutamyl-phosphate reductase [Clostridia bacterium]